MCVAGVSGGAQLLPVLPCRTHRSAAHARLVDPNLLGSKIERCCVLSRVAVFAANRLVAGPLRSSCADKGLAVRGWLQADQIRVAMTTVNQESAELALGNQPQLPPKSEPLTGLAVNQRDPARSRN